MFREACKRRSAVSDMGLSSREEEVSVLRSKGESVHGEAEESASQSNS